MSDDIVLTVRVRDHTQADFARLHAQLDRMRQDLRGVGGAGGAATPELHRMEQELHSVQDRAQQLSNTGQLASREFTHMRTTLSLLNREALQASRTGAITRDEYENLRNTISRTRIDFDGLNREVVRNQAELRAAAAEAARLARANGGDTNNTRTITVRVRDNTRSAFARIDSGLRSLQARVLAWSRSNGTATNLVGRGVARLVGLWRTGMARMGLETDRSIRLISRGFTALGGLMQTIARRSPMMAAALALLGPVAQVVGAALTVALGGAFIALGAYALRGNNQVKSAFTSMKTSVGTAVRDAAAPLVPFLVTGMNQVASAAYAMKPLLTQAFTAAGPLIKDLFGAVTDLASMALPGMVSALQASQPVMAGFRTAMGLVGQGVGDMFNAMTAGGAASGLQEVWKTLGEELRNVFRVFGDVMNQMANSGAATLALVLVFRGLLFVIQAIAAAFKVMDTLSFGWLKKLADAITGIQSLGTGGSTAKTSLIGLKQQLSDVNAEIAKQQAAKNIDTSGLIGSAKTYAQKQAGYDPNKLNALLAARASLEDQISTAAGKAAEANHKEAATIQEIVDAMRAQSTAALATLDAQAAYQQSIDDAATGAKKLTHALKFNGDQVNTNNAKSREAYMLLSTVAARTNDATQAMENQKKPWSQIIAQYKDGHAQLVALAIAMGANKTQAKALADQILAAPPSKKVRLTADMQDLADKIKAAKKKVADMPKSARTKVYAEIAAAAANLADIQAQLDALNGKTATTYVNQQTRNSNYNGNSATGATNAKPGKNRATGGPISGPGSGTSDSIPVMLSNGEYVINAAATRENFALLEEINSGKRRRKHFAKGGLTSAMTSARSDMWSGLNISYWGKRAGRTRSVFNTNMGSPTDLSSLVSTLNEWRAKIKAATSGSAEKHLLSSMEKTGKTLIKQEKALTKVNSALTAAKDKLASLKDAAAQLKDAVSSGINSSGNITGGVVTGKNTTAAGLINNLQSKSDQASALASALAELKKRGLNKQSLSEIAQAGIDGGGLETATALLGGTSGDIKSVNSLQKAIAASASAAGKTTADAMYAAGIKAADGLVKGLQKKQKSIENIMIKAATAFEKAIEKAIKGKAAGGPIGAASGGPRSAWTLVGEQGPEMVRLPYGSSVTPHGQSMQMLKGGGGGGARVIEVVVNLDGKTLGRQLVDPLRSEVYRLGGGNVQRALGRSSR